MKDTERYSSFEIWLVSSKKSIENADFHENLFTLWKYRNFHSSTPNGSKLSLETGHFMKI